MRRRDYRSIYIPLEKEGCSYSSVGAVNERNGIGRTMVLGIGGIEGAEPDSGSGRDQNGFVSRIDIAKTVVYDLLHGIRPRHVVGCKWRRDVGAVPYVCSIEHPVRAQQVPAGESVGECDIEGIGEVAAAVLWSSCKFRLRPNGIACQLDGRIHIAQAIPYGKFYVIDTRQSIGKGWGCKRRRIGRFTGPEIPEVTLEIP